MTCNYSCPADTGTADSAYHISRWFEQQPIPDRWQAEAWWQICEQRLSADPEAGLFDDWAFALREDR